MHRAIHAYQLPEVQFLQCFAMLIHVVASVKIAPPTGERIQRLDLFEIVGERIVLLFLRIDDQQLGFLPRRRLPF